jgi:AraC-like DNA-binding protein
MGASIAHPPDPAPMMESLRSRPTLPQAFRDTYGGSPMPWVRRRRLHRAMQRLVHPQPGDTVTAIGRAFGFASAVAFSREFRRQDDGTPSSVFRG